MGKLNRSPLEIIEEWTPINPSDPNALFEEGQKLRFILSLLLKARGREVTKQSERANKEIARIRRKSGLSPLQKGDARSTRPLKQS